MNRFLWLLVALSVAWPHSGQAAQLVGAASGSCMNLAEHGGTAPDGTLVRLFHCHDTGNQTWTISNGQIIGLGGKCLDVLGGSTSDTTPLILATCSSSASQQWSVQ
ncbi:MAG TPA: ricin-type beta-trefoil lectin domain protein [Steroidobacteraceae bacterium]